MSASPYPVHVAAELDPGLTRSLWLVTWLLAIRTPSSGGGIRSDSSPGATP